MIYEAVGHTVDYKRVPIVLRKYNNILCLMCYWSKMVQDRRLGSELGEVFVQQWDSIDRKIICSVAYDAAGLVWYECTITHSHAMSYCIPDLCQDICLCKYS